MVWVSIPGATVAQPKASKIKPITMLRVRIIVSLLLDERHTLAKRHLIQDDLDL